MEKIVFLHHSTGLAIWNGNTNKYVRKLTGQSAVKKYFTKYNKEHNTNYQIDKYSFPQKTLYRGGNDPFDYYNIWVKKGGTDPYMGEPTLEILTKQYNVIIFKHCFPVSRILEDTGMPDVNSAERRLENYKLQYNALKEKLHQFPDNKFIVWTPAVMVKNNLTQEEALRTQDFYNWILNDWDEKNDNIFIWDFYMYETEGGLYLKDEYSISSEDSHPNKFFAGLVAPLFAQYVIDVAQNKTE